MGANNSRDYKSNNTKRYSIELSAAEAKNGCDREVLIDGQMYKLNIPAGTEAGDMFEVRTGNDFPIGTVVISKVTGARASGGGAADIKPKKTIKPWMFIAAGAVIVAIIIAIAFGGDNEPSDCTGVPEYEGSVDLPSQYSHAGITFGLPSGWEEDTEWHETEQNVDSDSWKYDPTDSSRNDICVFIESYNRNSNKLFFDDYYLEGLEAFARGQYDWAEDSDETEVLDEGWMTIDGTDCWFWEDAFHNEEGGAFDSNTITVYIPISKDQVTSFKFWILKGAVNDDTGAYEDNENYDQERKLGEQIIQSIRITGEGVSEYGLPDYEEKDYSYEGITITLPDEFKMTDGSGGPYWDKPDWSDMYIGLNCTKDVADAAEHAESIAGYNYERYADSEKHENVNKGAIEIDGVTCYYSENTYVADLYKRYEYWLGVPIESGKKVIGVTISFDAEGLYTETDMELRDRIVNSIKID